MTGSVLSGRYEIVRQLGSGGAGRLLLVRDRRRDGEPCALKILQPRVTDPKLAELFRSEFLLLADLRHENIVGVQEFGLLEDQVPYFTMDFVPGENCRPFVREDRLETGDYLDLAAGLLAALAHIHARGVLHRDVKPENIIMRRGDGRLQPVLVDFGLAVMAGARRAGEASGTLPYIAPEVLSGAAADARADLFALGMVLYEVATGRHVADRREILRTPHVVLARDHVRRALRRHARGAVPRGYEEFVARLTAAAPVERYASAGEALQDLAATYGADLAGAAPVERARRRLGEAPLVGRESALEALLQRVEALREGRLLDPLVVVAGPEGIGVSRLLATLRNQAAVMGCIVGSGGSLKELAEDVLSHPSMGADGRGIGEDPAELVFRIDTALFLLPQEEAPVLILDDLHRLDEGACVALRDWIAALGRREGRARVLLVLGGRNQGDEPGCELLRTAGGAVPHELRDLAPLKKADVRAALAALLGQGRVPGDVVQALVRATGGNPRMLGEILQLLVKEGVLDLEGERPELHEEKLAKVKMPHRVAEATRRRVEMLPAEARDLVVRLALIREPLAAEAAGLLAGDRLKALEEEGLLLRDRGRYRFPSELLRRGADLLKGAARRHALRETAQALAAAAPEVAAPLLAEAGDLDEARRLGLPAAKGLEAGRRLEEAHRLLLPLLGEPPDLATGRQLMAVLNATGRFREAADLGARLAGDAADVETAFVVVTALRNAGRLPEALALLNGIDVPPGDAALAMRVANAKAALLDSQGRLAEALAESRRAEALGGSLLAFQGRIARIRANILRRARHDAAAIKVENALLAAPAVGDVERGSAFQNRGALHLWRGRVRASIADRRRSIQLSRLSGRLTTEARSLANLASVFLVLGRCSLALRCLDTARRLFEHAGNEEELAEALVATGEALLLAGRPGEADQRLRRAESLPGMHRWPRVLRRLSLVKALVAHLSGRAVEAAATVEHLAAADVAPGEERAEFLVLRSQLVSATGEPDASAIAWREALRTTWQERLRKHIPAIRVGLAECAAAKGAWNLAERLLGCREPDVLAWKTPVRAKALLVRAGAALHRGEAGKAGRLLEEAVVVVNRCDHAPARAETYANVASLLEEGELQRYLRQRTGGASAALLEVAREIWMHYGNEAMLRKIDLHLSELPRPATDPLAAPEADRLVKVLHITREMNREFQLDRLLELILDRAIELTGAERGFVILLDEGRERVHIARNIDRETVSEPERKVSSQIIQEVVRTGRIVRSENAESDSRFVEYLSVHQLHLRSIIAVPFRSGGKTVGGLYLDNRFRVGTFSDADERLLELFADQAVAAIDKAELVGELTGKREELEEIHRQQRQELKRKGKELASAQKELRQHRRARGWSFDRIIARSVAMQGIVREATRIAPTELAILLLGENGTGKEVLARAMHYASRRQDRPFVAINCAAFPEQLLESELFGHVRGSFTGADRDRAGLFEQANGGTLFLDEIGEMSAAMQVKLLRALESGEVRRIGDSEVRSVDVRLMSATNADLEHQIRTGRFREDLYYRIAGIVLKIPPLRERLEDVEPLAYAFVKEASQREGRPGLTISNEAIARLESFNWSGNVRELRNVILRAVVTAESDVIRPEDVKLDLRGPTVLAGLDPTAADRILDLLVRGGFDLNARQQTAINRALTRGKFSFGQYRELFRVSKSTTARDLDHLVSLGLLERRGKTRAVLYLPGPKLQEVVKELGGQRHQ